MPFHLLMVIAALWNNILSRTVSTKSAVKLLDGIGPCSRLHLYYIGYWTCMSKHGTWGFFLHGIEQVEVLQQAAITTAWSVIIQSGIIDLWCGTKTEVRASICGFSQSRNPKGTERETRTSREWWSNTGLFQLVIQCQALYWSSLSLVPTSGSKWSESVGQQLFYLKYSFKGNVIFGNHS